MNHRINYYHRLRYKKDRAGFSIANVNATTRYKLLPYYEQWRLFYFPIEHATFIRADFEGLNHIKYEAMIPRYYES